MAQLEHVHGTVTVEIGGAKQVADVAVAYEILVGGVGAQRGTVMVHEVKTRVGDVWLRTESALFYAVVSAITAAHETGTLGREGE